MKKKIKKKKVKSTRETRRDFSQENPKSFWVCLRVPDPAPL